MEMPEVVKKYWPWGVGAVVGLLLISRLSSGSSSSSGGSDAAAYAAANAAQAQAAAQAAAAGVQSSQIQAARDTSLAATQAASLASTQANQVQFVGAQAQLATSAGATTAAIIQSLQAPRIVAINGAALDNATTLQAAADAAKSSYGAVTALGLGASAMAGDAAAHIATAGGINAAGQLNGIYGLGSSAVLPNLTSAGSVAISNGTAGVVGAQAGSQGQQSAAQSAADAQKSNDAFKAAGQIGMALLTA